MSSLRAVLPKASQAYGHRRRAQRSLGEFQQPRRLASFSSVTMRMSAGGVQVRVHEVDEQLRHRAGALATSSTEAPPWRTCAGRTG